MNPHLNALLADERRMCCPCGARTARPGTLCRKCRHTALWLRHTRHAKRADRTARRLAKPATPGTLPHSSPWSCSSGGRGHEPPHRADHASPSSTPSMTRATVTGAFSVSVGK